MAAVAQSPQVLSRSSRGERSRFRAPNRRHAVWSAYQCFRAAYHESGEYHALDAPSKQPTNTQQSSSDSAPIITTGAYSILKQGLI
jgi:hypothetical protein